MTNPVAAWLAAFIVAAVAVDLALNGGQVLFFLAGRLAGLLEAMAFWR